MVAVRTLGHTYGTNRTVERDNRRFVSNASQFLKNGDRGPAVSALQEQLRSTGAKISVDGTFGPETERAVRAFQMANSCQVDGVVGPETRRALERAQATGRNGIVRRAPKVGETAPQGTIKAGEFQRPGGPGPVAITPARGPITHAPAGASEAEQYRHYEAIVRQGGGELRPGEKHVLALRGLDRNGRTHTTTSSREMNDSFVVLWKDTNGNSHVRHFTGSTHPGQKTSSMSPDVTRDGAGDVGMVGAGTFRAVANGPHSGAPSFHVRTTAGGGRLPGVRDTNHDGNFSEAEYAASARRGDTLSEVLLHVGTRSGNVASVGCMNVLDWSGFVSAVGGRGASFNFTVVDAAR